MHLDPHTIEHIATQLEVRAGNYLYQRAWRAAAKFVRTMLTRDDAKLTDKHESTSHVHDVR